ncbi:transcriptional regulator, GntR family [Aeromonas sp. RU39B]|uniref:FCD domain-containing protein n=1 Tax=Aeromonas sp. RU39B TaxID=1907416 RepID=UPI000954D50D|nr:FCD domain-containing protein [Aeromonas sp. RU39B]SIP91118.1 transcriptional regulator, GntR family [Aeromonas sp. RU39B]
MNTEVKRQYREVGEFLKQELASGHYSIGTRLPPERDIAEQLGVGRSVVREALIMLEIEGFVEVRKGSGIYVIAIPDADNTTSRSRMMGPFELLQARQLLESNIAEFAALQVTPSDIQKMRAALEAERRDLESGEGEDGDRDFHQAIAEATHNNLLVDLWQHSWESRDNNPMWQHLHERIASYEYRQEWLKDHQAILAAMQKKDPAAAKLAMWTHLENVKQRLMELSDVDAPEFDGYLFASYPVRFAS